MKFNWIWSILLFLCNDVGAANLCLPQEKTIFAFETKGNKVLSLCKENQDRYLVYRFGGNGNVEFQFPKNMNADSWKAFEFSGQRRLGLNNAGFGDYSISFSNLGNEYTVFQEWDDATKFYSIGVNIKTPSKNVTLNGIKKKQEGSLVLLEAESKNIINVAN